LKVPSSAPAQPMSIMQKAPTGWRVADMSDGRLAVST
jgi:hypothetical protein